jgi:hypothetical protein
MTTDEKLDALIAGLKQAAVLALDCLAAPGDHAAIDALVAKLHELVVS